MDAPHGAGVVAQLLEMPQVKCALDGLRATDIDVVTVSAKLRQALVALREVRGDEADACILGQRQRLCGDVLDSAFENAGAEQFAAHAPRCAALAEDKVRDVGAEARIAWRLAVVLGERTVVVEPGLRVADIEPELHDVVSAPAGITLREAGLDSARIDDIVCVNEQTELAARRLDARASRFKASLVAVMRHQTNAAVFLRQLCRDGLRRVGGPIIDHDDLERAVCLPQGALNSCSYGCLGVVSRNDDRYHVVFARACLHARSFVSAGVFWLFSPSILAVSNCDAVLRF